MILNVNSEIKGMLVQKVVENYQGCHPTDLLSKLKDRCSFNSCIHRI